LAYEERGHLLIFQDLQEYYIDPVHWYSNEGETPLGRGIEGVVDERGHVL
jgi:hypothetical protein